MCFRKNRIDSENCRKGDVRCKRRLKLSEKNYTGKRRKKKEGKGKTKVNKDLNRRTYHRLSYIRNQSKSNQKKKAYVIYMALLKTKKNGSLFAKLEFVNIFRGFVSLQLLQDSDGSGGFLILRSKIPRATQCSWGR